MRILWIRCMNQNLGSFLGKFHIQPKNGQAQKKEPIKSSTFTHVSTSSRQDFTASIQVKLVIALTKFYPTKEQHRQTILASCSDTAF